MTRIPVNIIVTDGLTRIRAKTDFEMVNKFATKMREAQVMADAAQFPPVTLFKDGDNRYFLADGFYRVFGAKMNGWRDVDAHVYYGTEEDALWYAVGANACREGSQPLTPEDVRHALVRVFKTWPSKPVDVVAAHMQQPEEVVLNIRETLRIELNLPKAAQGADGRFKANNTASMPEKKAAIGKMLREGKESREIRAALNVRGELVADVRRELGLNTKPKLSRPSRIEMVARIKELAENGYTVLQIMQETGMGEAGTRGLLKKNGIEVKAEGIVGKRRRVDSNRIVQQLVMDADSLTSDLDMVEFGELDKLKLDDWSKSLKASRRRLGEFISKLEGQQ